jgi:hypothetical protein
LFKISAVFFESLGEGGVFRKLGYQIKERPRGGLGSGGIGHGKAGGLGLADLGFVLFDKGVDPVVGNGAPGAFSPFFYLAQLFDKDIKDLEFVNGYSPDPFGSGNAGNVLEVGVDII